ncbi:MAG: ATPase [Candidatus Lambdaproteobacteria bacterium RIFOXYD1_FULL_56_27]|uniref:ATPase n=1 Tax=Candidatus Lambdaproteobacteria bacterium RIFOXYD2_FULL_56_26 TaxID=1817773 RepID=A0A1F6GR05_9PROT|nr:MAG: ATPase [Candidatus Lambdaproteobacteria bacterium RIFOXYD2_FULL_56_26]OGH01397.1 MAG: ATPase [Candidatus Lambdaproteobacteria bacterium RIFOXYC1_FULL_56_13]OGH06938.1 MAG: ATPase [Candidatus Lambdaproteobacteria bacterium RIFOXYD1_FULL_56_27]
MSKHDSAWPQDLIEREIVLTRVVDAPRELVFEAWTNPDHLPQWFGPDGFEIKTKEIQIVEGGWWRFDMIGPDGTCYGSRMEFNRIKRPSQIEVSHGEDNDSDPNRFFMLVTFGAQSNGKTVVTLRQLHPSTTRRDGVLAFGAVEFGYQTLDKLAKQVAGLLGSVDLAGAHPA